MPIGPGAFCVFVYVSVYNYVNLCTSHNNKPFTYFTYYMYSVCIYFYSVV